MDGMLLGKESSSPFCESWLGSAAAVFLHVWLVDMVLEWWQQLRQSQNKADARQSMQNGCNVGDPGSIPGWEDRLEKEMATHSSILAWKIP